MPNTYLYHNIYHPDLYSPDLSVSIWKFWTVFYSNVNYLQITTLTVLLPPPEPMGMCQRLVSASKEASFYIILEDKGQDLGTLIPLP